MNGLFPKLNKLLNEKPANIKNGVTFNLTHVGEINDRLMAFTATRVLFENSRWYRAALREEMVADPTRSEVTIKVLLSEFFLNPKLVPVTKLERHLVACIKDELGVSWDDDCPEIVIDQHLVDNLPVGRVGF